jgi:hypothetical protein
MNNYQPGMDQVSKSVALQSNQGGHPGNNGTNKRQVKQNIAIQNNAGGGFQLASNLP